MNRLNILQKIRPLVGTSSEEGKIKEIKIFCIEDGEPISANFWQPGGYQHQNHRHDRAFIFSPTTKWEFRDDGELRHFVAGTILWRQNADELEKRYCLFRRRAHPIGYYTIPAGHLEIGENPAVAALRETYEETRLGILSIDTRPFFQGEIQEECRRGADYHFWYLYSCQCTGDPCMSEEAEIIGWYTRYDILTDLKLTKPTGFFMTMLFGETPAHVREL